MMMDFNVKRLIELQVSDLQAHAVWASYYEPDDLEELVALGYDRLDCARKLEAINFSDEYVFPLPKSASGARFKYLYLVISAQTPDGHSLLGYRTSLALCLFVGERQFFFNPNLPDRFFQQSLLLSQALGSHDVFPMKLTYAASKSTELFKSPRGGETPA